jgi:hypothetical protein
MIDAIRTCQSEECIEYGYDKEEGMKDNRRSYGVTMHGFTLSTLNMLITLWTWIRVRYSLLYFHLCPKTSISKISVMPPSIHFSNPREF